MTAARFRDWNARYIENLKLERKGKREEDVSWRGLESDEIKWSILPLKRLERREELLR